MTANSSRISQVMSIHDENRDCVDHSTSQEPAWSRRTNALTEVRVVRVTPFRFGGPEAGETAKILRRALSE